MPNKFTELIDHTILKAAATSEDVAKLCREAKEYGFASVCVNPCQVKLAAELLKGTGVAVCTVIGFPLGANTREVKAFETTQARLAGAAEFDMVINIGALKAKDFAYVERDIAAVVQAAEGKTVKVIIETCYLTDEEKITACLLAQKAGAHYVKTSTGFGSGGATIDDVALMKRTVGANLGVKASGGIKTLEDARQMAEAGATRLGTSSGVTIARG